MLRQLSLALSFLFLINLVYVSALDKSKLDSLFKLVKTVDILKDWPIFERFTGGANSSPNLRSLELKIFNQAKDDLTMGQIICNKGGPTTSPLIISAGESDTWTGNNLAGTQDASFECLIPIKATSLAQYFTVAYRIPSDRITGKNQFGIYYGSHATDSTLMTIMATYPSSDPYSIRDATLGWVSVDLTPSYSVKMYFGSGPNALSYLYFYDTSAIADIGVSNTFYLYSPTKNTYLCNDLTMEWKCIFI